MHLLWCEATLVFQERTLCRRSLGENILLVLGVRGGGFDRLKRRGRTLFWFCRSISKDRSNGLSDGIGNLRGYNFIGFSVRLHNRGLGAGGQKGSGQGQKGRGGEGRKHACGLHEFHPW